MGKLSALNILAYYIYVKRSMLSFNLCAGTSYDIFIILISFYTEEIWILLKLFSTYCKFSRLNAPVLKLYVIECDK